MRRFWNWEPAAPETDGPAGSDTSRVLRINGVIAEESWFDDDITPQVFATELNNGSGDVTVWINSPGGDVVAAAQIYNLVIDHEQTHRVALQQQTRRRPRLHHTNASRPPDQGRLPSRVVTTHPQPREPESA